MKNYFTFTAVITLTICLFVVSPGLCQQQKTITPDLTKLAAGKSLRVFNRTVNPITDGSKKGVHLDARQGDGGAFLEGVQFTDGVIEFDVRGKDVMQQSFVGIAFHVSDSVTYDAIYFRPFNFNPQDPARKKRAVQYISHPQYPWDKLRGEHPGKYENAVEPAPDPNGWFHVRVVVKKGQVTVFVNDAKSPSLTVGQLSKRQGGMIGLWVGNNSEGDFANLQITPSSDWLSVVSCQSSANYTVQEGAE
jgi:hypothetical protein